MAHSAATQQNHDHTNLPVGEILRKTRVHYDKSIQDVENALRIRAEQIEAIEGGHAEKLPARVYAIGFVRSYAEYLGLDGDKMVDLFKNQSVDQAPEPALQFPVAASDSKAPPVWIVLVCIAAFILIVGGWFSAGSNEETTIDAVPEVPAELKPETLEEAQIPQEPEPEPEIVEEEAPKPKGITLTLKENSWVEIRGQGGQKLLSRVLKAGDKYFVPDREDLSISIGNASGVEIAVDGEALRALGPKGKVIRNIPLNADILKDRFSVAAQE